MDHKQADRSSEPVTVPQYVAHEGRGFDAREADLDPARGWRRVRHNAFHQLLRVDAADLPGDHFADECDDAEHYVVQPEDRDCFVREDGSTVPLFERPRPGDDW